jgi:hypothetical protein
VSTADVLDLAALGVTSQSLQHAFLWGFGAVLACFIVGWIAGVGTGLVRKA